MVNGIIRTRKVDEIKTPFSRDNWHSVHKDSNGNLWLKKREREIGDAINEATAAFLFSKYPVGITVPQVAFSSERRRYFVEYFEGATSYSSEAVKGRANNFYRQVKKKLHAVPQRYSSLLHIVNDDYDRTIANYMFDRQGRLIAIDNAGGWSGYILWDLGSGRTPRYVGKSKNSLPKNIPVFGSETNTIASTEPYAAHVAKGTFKNGDYYVFVTNGFIDPFKDSPDDFLKAAAEIKGIFDYKTLLNFLLKLPGKSEVIEHKLEKLVRNVENIDRAVALIFETYRALGKDYQGEMPKGLSFVK